MQIHSDCKKWHAIFAYAKAAPLFAAGDLRRYVKRKADERLYTTH